MRGEGNKRGERPTGEERNQMGEERNQMGKKPNGEERHQMRSNQRGKRGTKWGIEEPNGGREEP